MVSRMEYVGLYPPNENLKSVLEKALEENGFKDCQIDIKPLGDKGDNYIGEIYIADVEIADNKIINLIIKIGQENEEVRRKTQTPVMFKNEILTYTKTLPMCEEIQIACSIDEEKRYKFAKCYGSDLTLGKECIILENLKIQGYAMENRLNGLSYEYVKAAVENLAKYHALSFVFRERYEEKYKSVIDTMRDYFSLYAKSETFMNKIKGRLERAAMTVDDEDHKERVRRSFDKIEDLFLHSHKPWSDRLCVINHGDSWMNNILFKTERGLPVDTIMVDYQLAKHSSPVLDILYFIFISTDSALREQHFDDLKDSYYNSLSRFMDDLGYEADKFYTRDQMERDIIEYSPCTLGLAVIALPMITAEKEDIPDLKNPEDLLPETGISLKRYEKKMGDVIRDFVKYKFI